MNNEHLPMPSSATEPSQADWIKANEMGYDLVNQMHKAAKYEAEHDPLTGVLNLAGLDEKLHLIDSNTTEVAMLFIDGDNIKAINDNLGHEAGDRAIVGTAITLESCLRDGDVIARIGGDEFVVLLINEPRGEEEPVSLDQRVINIKERLKKCIKKFQDDNPDLRDQGFGLSAGSAIRTVGQPIAEVKLAAEKQMYEVKNRTSREMSDEQRAFLDWMARSATKAGLDPSTIAKYFRSI